MSRNSYRNLRKQKLVRNITILCGCLVVLVMLVERGMVSNDSPTPPQGDPTKPSSPLLKTSSSPPNPSLTLGLSDDASGGFIPSSEDSLLSSEGEEDKDKDTGNPPQDSPFSPDHLPPNQGGSLNDESEEKDEGDPTQEPTQQNAPSPTPQDQLSPNQQANPFLVQPDSLSPYLGPLSSQSPSSNQQNKTQQNSDQQNTNQLDPDQNPFSSNSYPSQPDPVSPNPNPTPPFNPLPSLLDGNKGKNESSTLSPKSELERTPYSDGFNDLDPHVHSSEDEEVVHVHTSDENGGNMNSPHDETQAVPPKNDMLSTEKDDEEAKKKALNKAEKEMLEKKVKKEYEDELAGLKSNITHAHNSTSLLLPRPLLFIHVPKTAGSTLAQVFKSNTPFNKYYHFWSHPRVSELHHVPDKEVIFGHFRYGLHFYMPNQTATYATMLREPIDRVISYYHFHLQDPQDPAHKFAKEHTFEEWLEESPAAQNEMTQCLSGIRSEFSPSKESFEMAKHHLSRMGFVGLTEHFDESLKLMKFYFGFKELGYSQTKVGVKKPHELSPEVKEKIRQKNLMDIELYEMAKEMFQKQMNDLSKYLLQQEMVSQV